MYIEYLPSNGFLSLHVENFNERNTLYHNNPNIMIGRYAFAMGSLLGCIADDHELHIDPNIAQMVLMCSIHTNQTMLRDLRKMKREYENTNKKIKLRKARIILQ
eukprot:501971_1